MNWENQWSKYIEYFNRGADELKISIRHVSTSAILVSISKAPRSDALKSLHGGDALRAWPCTWRGTNSSKSGCRGVFRVLWDAPPRKCDGTCSTGMMGRMIGWVWWAGIAGKAWSACATTCYLCLVWMSRGVDPPITPLTASNTPVFPSHIPIGATVSTLKTALAKGVDWKCLEQWGKNSKLNNTGKRKAFSVSTLFGILPSALSLDSLQNERQSVYLHLQSRDACASENWKLDEVRSF